MDRAKCWYRLRRTTTEIVALSVGVGFLAPLAAQENEAAAERDAPHSLAREQWPAAFVEFLETVTGFRAQFVQELWSEDQRLIEVAEGSVELQRPGRFRWHYVTPYEQLIVADGENLWMYDVDIAQVTRSDLAANDPGNPAALLTGDTDVEEHFAVVAAHDDAEETWVELAPRDPASDFSAVRIRFAHSQPAGTLSALEFEDGLSQTTVIRFQDAESNPELGPGHFEFEVPENVHVLGGAG